MTAYTFGDLITFTRASTATYVNSAGNIASAAINAPRFDYDPVTLAAKGFLVEEQRTNLATYSEDFASAAWGAGALTVTGNNAISPAGSITASRVLETSATTNHSLYNSASFSVTSTTIYTASVFVKSINNRYVQLVFDNNATTAGGYANFDLQTATVTAGGNYGSATGYTASATLLSNGWVRIVLTTQPGGSFGRFSVNSIPNGTAGLFAGFTGNTSNGYYIWGAQLEAGAFATSYIPTVASQVTRTADVATMTGADFSSWYNANAGTFVAEFDAFSSFAAGVTGYTPFAVSDGTGNNIMYTYLYATTLGAKAVTGGVNQAEVFPTGSLINNVPLKMAMAYKVNDFASAVNGNTPALAMSLTVPVVNQLGIGVRSLTPPLNGHIRSIRYYPVRLTNAQLQALTA